MVVVDFDGVLDLDDLPSELSDVNEQAAPTTSAGSLAELAGKPLSDVERLFIAETLKHTGGNRESAAEMLVLLHARLLNDSAAEIHIAAEEQSKITQLRLRRLG